MKIKLLALFISFGAFAETVDNEYMLSINKKFYKNSIVVVQSNSEIEQPTEPVCGSANGVAVDLKPTENLCETGTPLNVITSNGSHTWTCEIGEEKESCAANQIINTAKHSSCKDMLEEYPQLSGQNGVYPATVGGLNSNLYCNMTDQGGGWTLVVAQFENNVALWNEGIQADYDPSLSTSRGFALNTAQIPEHTQMSFSHSNYQNKRIQNVFDYVYTTGNIDKTLITDNLSNQSYSIHRNTAYFHNYHNPEYSTSTNAQWLNTLTISKKSTDFFSYTFSPLNTTPSMRGYAYNIDRSSVNDTGAWLLFVK